MNVTLPHRTAAQKFLGWRLRPDEIVHHIDLDHSNNNPSNLQIVTVEQHTKIHSNQCKEIFKDEAQKSSIVHLINHLSPEKLSTIREAKHRQHLCYLQQKRTQRYLSHKTLWEKHYGSTPFPQCGVCGIQLKFGQKRMISITSEEQFRLKTHTNLLHMKCLDKVRFQGAK